MGIFKRNKSGLDAFVAKTKPLRQRSMMIAKNKVKALDGFEQTFAERAVPQLLGEIADSQSLKNARQSIRPANVLKALKRKNIYPGSSVAVFHGISAKEFSGFAEKAGLKPEIRHGDGETAIVELNVLGCRTIAMLLVPAGGSRFNSVQFWVAWKDELTIDEANRWNSMRRYAFAYRDEQGHANLQMDVSMIGLADEGVEHYLGLWSHMVGSFMSEMA